MPNNTNNEKKYASLSTLQTFLENLRTTFSSLSHKHTISDITDYTVDSELSSTSTNPVQNKVLDAEFDAIATGMNALEQAIDGKASSTHNHDSAYAAKSHNHDGVYATANHNHDTKYDTLGSSAAVQENLDTVSDTLDAHTTNSDVHVTTTNKSNWNSAYTHSTSAHARADATKVEDSTTNGNIKINGTETNVYSHPNSGVTAGTYKSVTVNAQGHVTSGSNPTTLSGYGITDAETKSDASAKLAEAKTYTDTVASGKSDSTHHHDLKYDVLGAAAESLASAKSYTDTKTANLASTAAVDSKISTHNTSSSAHSDIRDLISGLTTRLNTLANSDDTTLDQMSEVVAYIKNNKSLIDGITTSKVNVSDIVNNLTTNVSNKPLSAAQGVAIKALIDALQEDLDSHTHAISDVSGLQSALDGKAASSHGTHVTYSTTAPVMDGTAAVGTASTVARSDHKHPTDTSRASKSELDTHTGDTTKHITSTERSNWNTAATDVVTAQARADSAYSLAESKVGSLSDLGVTATAAELNYVDGVTSNVQTQLDGKANTSHGNHVPATQTASNKVFLRNDNTWATVTPANIGAAASSHTHTVANITDLTATATELNYMDGVTSAVQTQLDSKQATITGGATTITSSNLTESRALVSNSSGKVAVSDITSTELGYLDGVTSNVQAQIDSKSDSSHTHTGLNYIANVTSDVQTQLNAKSSATNIVNGTGTKSLLANGATTASGQYSLAEGQSTTASGDSSHAEGYKSVASGSYSHAEGRQTNAVGAYSHSEGYGTSTTIKLTGDASAKTYTVNSASSEIRVGRVLQYGTTCAKITAYDSSALTVTVSPTLSSSALSSASVTLHRGIAYGQESHSEGYYTTASSEAAHAEGYHTIASGTRSHAEGSYTNATGYYSHAEGESTTASSSSAHAEGSGTLASGGSSHAEGSNTTASGSSSHAQGYRTTASASYSHAEGGNTVASGAGSHAEGYGTIAKGESQHVQGEYNIEDTSNTYAHIVGNGSSSARSNAHTIDWQGNAWFAGNIYTGGTSQSSGATMLASMSTLTTAEYTALEEAEATNANTLYMLTDAEEDELITVEDIDAICGATL